MNFSAIKTESLLIKGHEFQLIIFKIIYALVCLCFAGMNYQNAKLEAIPKICKFNYICDVTKKVCSTAINQCGN